MMGFTKEQELLIEMYEEPDDVDPAWMSRKLPETIFHRMCDKYIDGEMTLRDLLDVLDKEREALNAKQ